VLAGSSRNSEKLRYDVAGVLTKSGLGCVLSVCDFTLLLHFPLFSFFSLPSPVDQPMQCKGAPLIIS